MTTRNQNRKDIYDAATTKTIRTSTSAVTTNSTDTVSYALTDGDYTIMAHVTAIDAGNSDETYTLTAYASTSSGGKTLALWSSLVPRGVTVGCHYPIGTIYADQIRELAPTSTYLDFYMAAANTSPSITFQLYAVPLR